VSTQRVLLIFVGVIIWFAAIVGVPFGAAWACQELGAGEYSIAAWGGSFLVLLVGTVGGVIVAILYSGRQNDRFVREQGAACTAYVKGYRRVSMTQHRVLLLIEFPAGPQGREYMLSGLDDQWLADVCARALPTRVIAHPEGQTVVFT
jgi:hypothetical protein